MQELRQYGIKTIVIEPGMVATDMTKGSEGVIVERMIQPEDIAQTALLPFKMSPSALPVEVVLKLALSAYE